MSTRNTTRPLPEITAFRYRPGDRYLLLFLAYQGKSFPLRIDLKWAGAGLYSYAPNYGTLMFSRGRKGKPATEGTVFMDHMANTVGHFTATRAMAERLLLLLWGQPITLDEWPADAVPQVTGATVTEEAITVTLCGYTPLRVPRVGTRLRVYWEDTPHASLARLVVRVKGRRALTVMVDTESSEGQAALTALGFPGYAPREGVRPAHEHLNAAD